MTKNESKSVESRSKIANEHYLGTCGFFRV